MSISVKLSNKIIDDAKAASERSGRSVAEQVEHWVEIGKVVEENADLTYEFIKNILVAKQEAKSNKLKH